VAVALLIAPGGATPTARAALDDAAAAVIHGPTQEELGRGQYWYTRSVIAGRVPLPIAKPGTAPGQVTRAPGPAWYISRVSVENWIGGDGTLRVRTIPLSARFASAADRARWLAAEHRLPASPPSDAIVAGDGWFPPQLASTGPDAGDGLFSYSQLQSLATSPDALRQQIERAQTAFDKREGAAFAQSLQSHAPGQRVWLVPQQTNVTRGGQSAIAVLRSIDALLSTPVPSPVRAALFRVASTLPGIMYEGKVRDALGRPGVAVSVGRGANRVRLIFDSQSGALLANEEGRISKTVVAQGVAKSIRSLPAHASPVAVPAGLKPERIAISPRVGVPGTTFTLTLRDVRSSTNAGLRRKVVLLSGPGGASCKAAIPPVVIPAPLRPTTSQASGALTLQMSPRTIRRAAWCPGRYQVQVNGSAVFFRVAPSH
jgi:hypothetical protein